MATIRKLKDGPGNTVYPVTHEKAVLDNSGTTLDTKLQNLEDNVSLATMILCTEEEYEAMAEAGTLDPSRFYATYED